MITPQAYKNDGLPENVCIGCLSEINRAFSFKKRSERSENTLRQYLHRLAGQSTAENESKLSSDSVMSGTADDENYEIIEVDEDEQSVSNTEPMENFKNEIENDENSRNKVFVLTRNERLPDPINVIYECHKCYDTFDSIALSEQHMAKFHSENDTKDVTATDERITSPTCSLNFDEAYSLDQHIRQNHSSDNDVVESHFETEDGNSADIVELDDDGIIQEIVADEVTMKDEIVPAIIVVTSNESIETDLKFVCQKCGGKFAKERSLNIHTKLNKCTIKSFECKICKKVFVRKKNLNSHMQTHNEPSDYSCKVCNEKFSQADQLAIHIQMQHEPSRKYLCPHCWKGRSKTCQFTSKTIATLQVVCHFYISRRGFCLQSDDNFDF